MATEDIVGGQAGLLEGFWTPEQMASQAGVTTRTLARWHHLRIGPPRTRFGRTVLYRIASARAWLRAQEEPDVRGSARGA